MCSFTKLVGQLRAGHCGARHGWQNQFVAVAAGTVKHFAVTPKVVNITPYEISAHDLNADDWVFFRAEDALKITAQPVVHTP